MKPGISKGGLSLLMTIASNLADSHQSKNNCRTLTALYFRYLFVFVYEFVFLYLYVNIETMLRARSRAVTRSLTALVAAD